MELIFFVKNNQEVDKTVVYHIAYVKEMTNKPSEEFKTEILSVVWLNKEDAYNKLTFQASKNILNQACEYLGI